MGHKIERSGTGCRAGDPDECGQGLCALSRTNWTFPARWFLKAIYEAGLIQLSCETISKQEGL